MSKSLKLALGAMIAVAFLILFATFTSIGSNNSSASIQDELNSQIANLIDLPDNDTDNDGLNDSIEAIQGTDPLNPDTDGDGFWDGEEFLSGCDPLVLPPLDCTSTQNGQNLTSLIGNRITQGLVAGETFGDTMSAELIENITSDGDQKVLAAFDASFTDYTDDDLIVIDSNDQKTIRHYVYNLAAIVNKDIARSSYEITAEDIQEGINYTLSNPSSENPFFMQQAEIHEAALRQLLAIPVPRMFVNDHLYLTEVVSDLSVLYRLAGNSNDDIVATRLALKTMPVAFEHLATATFNFSTTIYAYR
jgi:hypothetical protein